MTSAKSRKLRMCREERYSEVEEHYRQCTKLCFRKHWLHSRTTTEESPGGCCCCRRVNTRITIVCIAQCTCLLFSENIKRLNTETDRIKVQVSQVSQNKNSARHQLSE